MANLTADTTQQQVNIQAKCSEFEKKERKAYEALAALINFIEGKKKYTLKPATNFLKFKKETLATAAQLQTIHQQKSSSVEPKFNVTHYVRAIKSASDATYRNMTIQAANKDLSRAAMGELVLAIQKHCRDVSQKMKELTQELQKVQRKDDEDNAREFLQKVVEPMVDGVH